MNTGSVWVVERNCLFPDFKNQNWFLFFNAMKILYYDCSAGISGDMNLAAMIGLGVDGAFLQTELARLGLGEEFALRFAPGMKNGIAGIRVDVELNHHHEKNLHDAPTHDNVHAHTHAHHGEHRNLAEIETIINRSSLDDAVKQTACAIFHRVASAEASVHHKPLNEVHFHEVGATDSIVDIVGAAICFHALGVDAVWSRSIELGGGCVRCAHGLLPVPAPATVEILTGLPITRGAVDHECTTPTGAAILAELVDHFTDTPAMTVLRTAYGVGHRDAKLPNLLRVHLAEVQGAVSVCHAQGFAPFAWDSQAMPA